MFMKTHKIILLFLCLLVGSAYAQDYAMATPFGYGAGTTGGGSATAEKVTTYNELKSALTSNAAKVIVVSGVITIPSKGRISIKSNKTLLGLPGAKLISNDQTKEGSGILSISSSNVIIRNLTFEGPGAYDTDGRDLLSNEGTRVWVDHCEFYDGVDGNFDNTGSADNVSITWCKFGYNKPAKAGGSGGSPDHRYSNLVGGDVDDYPGDGRYSITFAYCYWANGVKERMPRARNAQLHLLNNYTNSSAGKTIIGLGDGDKGSDCYVENCVFDGKGTVLDTGYAGKKGKATIIGCSKGNTTANGGSPKPAYSYTALPVNEVKAVVSGSCGAGATLQVTEAGVVSANAACSGTVTPPPTPLETPSNINAIPTDNSIQLSWNAVTGATSYEVKVCGTTSGGSSKNITFNDATADAAIIGDRNLATGVDIIGSAKAKIVAKTGNYGGVAITKYLDFGGGGSTTSNALKIACDGAGTLTVYNNAGTNSRTIAVHDGSSVIGNITTNDGTVDIPAAGNYYLYSTGSGIQVYVLTFASSSSCQTKTANSNSFTITNLSPDTEYSYQVKAIKVKGSDESEYSAIKTITTNTLRDDTSISETGEDDKVQIRQTAHSLEVSGVSVEQICLYNIAGAQIDCAQAAIMDIRSLGKGIYIARIQTKQAIIPYKFIK